MEEVGSKSSGKSVPESGLELLGTDSLLSFMLSMNTLFSELHTVILPSRKGKYGADFLR